MKDELIEEIKGLTDCYSTTAQNIIDLRKEHYRQIALNAVVAVMPDIGMNKYLIVRKAINKAFE